jgi:choline dehydrogenase-like flavoprotein
MSLSELQRATLVALCDTAVPSVTRAQDGDGFWARSASDVGADAALLEMVEGLPPEQLQGTGELLEALAQQGFAKMSGASREQVLTNVSLANQEAAMGVASLVAGTLLFSYALPDPATGRNPFWKTFGYPGPIAAPPAVAKPIAPLQPEAGQTLECDVVVVGSGAGGGVIAGKLAESGLEVVVLEMGGYFNESDYNQLELWAWQNLYWRGGPVPSADMNITLMAGSSLGGGTEVNWTNSLRTKEWVREQWARDHGLQDVATDAYDRHLDEVCERVSVNTNCSELNPPHEAMRRAAERLGWSFATVARNWDPARHDAAAAGYMGFGDSSGAKRSTQRTYLADAAAAGARFLVGCLAERVLIESGRAAGVAARWTGEDGESFDVSVRAPQVVVACGSLESPALLLRSGIGGPAAGRYLRLHPSNATIGDYGQDMRAWWGAAQAGLVNEFANVKDGYGFLIEGVQYTTGLGASAVPWTGGAEHKQVMQDFKDCATWVGLVRDRGSGHVSIDADGQAVVWYSLDDELDRANTARSLEMQIRGHVAAGARRVFVAAQGRPTWRVGDDLEGFIARVQRIPPRAGGLRLFTAHQMGTCRMGSDPATSVANVRGELHDTPGVWVGDASAFPTSTGTNPMITVMALASRTAEQIAQDARERKPAAVAANGSANGAARTSETSESEVRA